MTIWCNSRFEFLLGDIFGNSALKAGDGDDGDDGDDNVQWRAGADEPCYFRNLVTGGQPAAQLYCDEEEDGDQTFQLMQRVMMVTVKKADKKHFQRMRVLWSSQSQQWINVEDGGETNTIQKFR